MLGKFTREDEADTVEQLGLKLRRDTRRNLRGLDLAGGNGGLLVVCSQLGCLGGDALEDIIDEGVQD